MFNFHKYYRCVEALINKIPKGKHYYKNKHEIEKEKIPKGKHYCKNKHEVENEKSRSDDIIVKTSMKSKWKNPEGMTLY